jgi:hypothetical protein
MRLRASAVLTASLAVAILAGFVATDSALASGGASRLHVVVTVDRFAVGPRAAAAQGTVTANLTDQAGHTTTIRAPIALTARSGGACQILNLDLRQLNLILLGLNVHLDRVHLVITGHPGGGVLGSLFCRLARTKAAADRAAIARTMNASLRRHPLKPMAFSVSVSPMAARAAGATCPVLDLILGPLNLNLLGLEVDLNQVHLTITATQGGGTLGDLFCSLSH